jgi:uncharacterized protein involved in exopolysaccharide biosynthesis
VEESQSSISRDIGKALEAILRQWQLIAALVLVCALTAGLTGLLAPKQYRASVLVASTKTASAVSFGSAIETMTEGQLIASGTGAYGLIDRQARQQSYVQLVKNPAVAQAVLETFGSQLKESEREIPKLLRMVEGEVAGSSDSVRISVTYHDPEIAAALADAWGQAYVNHVNAVYSESGSNESYVAVNSQLEEARENYDRAQAELEEFITANRVDKLTRQVAEHQALIDSLSTARSTAVTTLIEEQTKAQQQVIQEYFNTQAQSELLALRADQEARQVMVSEYITAMVTMRQDVFTEQVKHREALLAQAYEDQRRVSGLLRDARDMRLQVEAGGAAAASSNALALTLLKAQAFANQEGPNDLIIQTTPAIVAPEAFLLDLDGLISALESRQKALEQEIQELSEALLAGEDLQYLDQALGDNGALAAVIQERYPELFENGALAGLAENPDRAGSALSENTRAQAEALLQLEGLEAVLGFSLTDGPVEQKLDALEQQLGSLKAELAQEEDRLNDLTHARDLAWETYNTLATKEAELRVAVRTRGTEVALASPAAVPDQDLVSGVRNILLASIAGLLLGIGAVFLLEFWWSYKGLQPRPVVLISLPPRKYFQASGKTR